MGGKYRPPKSHRFNPENQTVSDRRRFRESRNELERIRRNNQKVKLDELRAVLPFPDIDDKTSLTSILEKAREYINVLEQRIVELQNVINNFNNNNNKGNEENIQLSLCTPTQNHN